MNLGSTVKGATYRTEWGYRFRVRARSKTTVIGEWTTGPLRGREARLEPRQLTSRAPEIR